MRAITGFILLSVFVLTLATLHAKDGTDNVRAGQKLFAPVSYTHLTLPTIYSV